MIKILVDEAYAFDMLSILEVKLNEDSSDLNRANMARFAENIADELGFETYFNIWSSKEYKDLKDVNYCIFKRVNEIKKREADASDATYIDDMNYRRFLTKKILQEKFFSGQQLSEQKMGYNK